MALEVLGQENPFQAGMARELDAHQVEGLPLVKVEALPDPGQGWEGRIIFGHRNVELQHRALGGVGKVVDAFETVDEVHGRKQRGVVESQIVPQAHSQFQQSLAILQVGPDHVLPHHLGLDDMLVKLPFQGLAELCGQGHLCPSLLRKTSLRSAMILRCSCRKPWSRASGRTGQPGMYTSTGRKVSAPGTTE